MGRELLDHDKGLLTSARLRRDFGEIDIYLFDQLLRGRFDERRRILDAGCGAGRNLPYFLQHGFEVWAADTDAAAVEAVRRLAGSLAPGTEAPDRIVCAPLERLPWADGLVDAVVCSAVLHFARDEQHFGAMVAELWRLLAPGGLFFARLASSIGLEAQLPSPVGRVRLPDGSARFVTDEATLLAQTARLGGRLLDPIKTTNVQNLRAMTTWVVEKPRGAGDAGARA